MNIFEWMTSAQQKRAVERFMVKLINHKQLLENQPESDRGESRYHASFETRVMDWNGKRGEPQTAFFTVTRDITASGLAFLTSRIYATEDRVAVSILFEGEYHHLLCEVRHCTPLGREVNLVGTVALSHLDPTPELAVDTPWDP